MKAFCQLCKEEGHWSAQCPRLKHTTHGKTPSAGAKPKATEQPKAQPCPDCATAQARIAELEALLAVAVASTPVVPTSSHNTHSDITNNANVMSTSPKEMECPECLKRKQKRAQAQKQWRQKTKPTAKPRPPAP